MPEADARLMKFAGALASVAVHPVAPLPTSTVSAAVVPFAGRLIGIVFLYSSPIVTSSVVVLKATV